MDKISLITISMAEARRKKFAKKHDMPLSFLRGISLDRMSKYSECKKGNLPYPTMRRVKVGNTTYLIPRTKLGLKTYVNVILKKPSKKNLVKAARRFKIPTDGNSKALYQAIIAKLKQTGALEPLVVSVHRSPKVPPPPPRVIVRTLQNRSPTPIPQKNVEVLFKMYNKSKNNSKHRLVRRSKEKL